MSGEFEIELRELRIVWRQRAYVFELRRKVIREESVQTSRLAATGCEESLQKVETAAL
jgi:hypothetical protein